MLSLQEGLSSEITLYNNSESLSSSNWYDIPHSEDAPTTLSKQVTIVDDKILHQKDKHTNQIIQSIEVMSYKINIDIGAETENFTETSIYSGSVNMKFLILEEIKEFELHSLVQTIKLVKIKSDGISQESNPKYHLKDDRIQIITEQYLTHGEYELEIDFENIIRIDSDMTGIYRDLFGNIQVQSEPIYARRVFPCIDQPNAKATYRLNVSVVVKNRTKVKKLEEINDNNPYFIVVANQNCENLDITQISNELKLYKYEFGETFKFSTYLFSFLAGKFRINTSQRSFQSRNGKLPLYGIVPETYDPRDITNALEAFKNTLTELTKLDVIYLSNHAIIAAVPDFGAGAMENPGLILYRISTAISSKGGDNIREINDVVGHEVFHSFAGTLLTMNTFNDLWINESQTSFGEGFLKYKLSQNYINEELKEKMFMKHANGIISMGLKEEYASSVLNRVTTPERFIEYLFSTKTYEFGAAILYMTFMMIAYLHKNQDPFQYFEKYIKKIANSDLRFKAVNSATLINEIAESSGMDEFSKMKIRNVLFSYLKNPNIPLVSISVNKNGKKIIIKQREYTYIPTEKKNSPKWLIPMFLTNNKLLFLDQRSKRIKIPDIKSANGLNFHNCDGRGLHVQYHKIKNDQIDNFVNISLPIKDKLSLSKRKFILDAIMCFKIGLYDFDIINKIAENLKKMRVKDDFMIRFLKTLISVCDNDKVTKRISDLMNLQSKLIIESFQAKYIIEEIKSSSNEGKENEFQSQLGEFVSTQKLKKEDLGLLTGLVKSVRIYNIAQCMCYLISADRHYAKHFVEEFKKDQLTDVLGKLPKIDRLTVLDMLSENNIDSEYFKKLLNVGDLPSENKESQILERNIMMKEKVEEFFNKNEYPSDNQQNSTVNTAYELYQSSTESNETSVASTMSEVNYQNIFEEYATLI
ncbi:MAG: hypothetical protein MHPSP_000609 [Paramarteilia canceri]